ncbi:uncharacterized protein LOC122948544 [Acropora millepora]|uniref:uncharacterized protein LOC122948544 n=1 Tax=Acropora millepora TaxID=45264 RepID=UPI001CF1E399|nr:uncharacterized protein LOC122948544 [Acropora millepora]
MHYPHTTNADYILTCTLSLWLLVMFSGDANRTPLFSKQDELDQRTGMIGTATAAHDEEVLGKPEEDTDQMARFTPCHKTEVHFNGLVQQCPPCLETVRTPVQFPRSFFRECLDELANFIVRLDLGTIVVPDPDTFTYTSLSFWPNVGMRTPILRAYNSERPKPGVYAVQVPY